MYMAPQLGNYRACALSTLKVYVLGGNEEIIQGYMLDLETLLDKINMCLVANNIY